MNYILRERFFSACGPNLCNWTTVFAADDLTDDECEALAESVQRCLDEAHDQNGGGPWHFILGPSADEDRAAFINLKSEWNGHKYELERYLASSGNSWQSEIAWFHGIAVEYAEIIRDMRCGRTQTIYLQCDAGSGFETFDCIDYLTEQETETLGGVLGPKLYELGLVLRIVDDWHAEKEPVIYVQARLSWKSFEEDLQDDTADQTRFAASNLCYECCEEIKALRKKPLQYASAEFELDDEDEAELATPHTEQTPTKNQLASPDVSFCETYRDPDNYWRNVWLYQQRQTGKTNSTILSELVARANEFAPIESENALRSAIESIAHHHQWPLIKGRPGRPRAKSDPVELDSDAASSRQSNGHAAD